MFNCSTKNSFNRFDNDLNGDDKILLKSQNFPEFWALKNCLFFDNFCLEDIISNYEQQKLNSRTFAYRPIRIVISNFDAEYAYATFPGGFVEGVARSSKLYSIISSNELLISQWRI